MKKILETRRLYLRELTQGDFDDLCEILQDTQTMEAYVRAFTDAEVQEWLNRQIRRYAADGVGLWAVIDKESGSFIGQVGLTMQDTPDGRVLEIGYLLKRRFWHMGYAAEAAAGCKRYAFEVLRAPRVTSIIRDSNLASQRVALRNGMTESGGFVKHYRGIDMPHIIFAVENTEAGG